MSSVTSARQPNFRPCHHFYLNSWRTATKLIAVEAVPFTSASKYVYDIGNVVGRVVTKGTCAKRVRLQTSLHNNL